ncbi:MAG TPA: hypothetical protein VGW10_19390 [Solirubrobacteraceae bacterium]|nr:hypothetical protein [Solirubrobacteraceae bacterium]
MVVGIVIVTECGEPELLPAILAFLGLMTTTVVAWYGNLPIDRGIGRGEYDDARLQELLLR